MTTSASKIAGALGGVKSLGKRVQTMRDLENLIAVGLPKSALDILVDEFSAHLPESSKNDIRYRIVPRTTYKRFDPFSLQTSETIERIARLYAIAVEVFTESAVATRFMMQPHPELDNRSPFETALTEIGGRAVEEVLGRGMHGLPA